MTVGTEYPSRLKSLLTDPRRLERALGVVLWMALFAVLFQLFS
jgi:hypothetical protein